ncbi:MAG: MFS transporter [Phycisphaerales bacterium]|nr:MFS transporter [Phycisphaerales bacterium]
MTAPIEPTPRQSPAAAECVAIPSARQADRLTPARRFALIAATHSLIDIFPIFFTSLMLVFQGRLNLSAQQETIIYMLTPIFSGSTQPFFAWLSDKFDTRLCGPIGLALGATCIGSIGFAQNFEQLIALQILGVIGTGMYHPIGVALAGQSGMKFLRRGRTQAIGLFIAAGMLGQAVGPQIATRVSNAPALGMEHLAWLIIPAIIAAIALHNLTRRMPHRHDDHRARRASFDHAESRRRWFAIGVITAQNALRFTSNVGMFVMFNVWAKSKMLAHMPGAPEAKIDESGAAMAAKLASAMTIGMGVCVLTVGWLVPRGREHRPLWLFSLIGAAAMASAGYIGDWGVEQFGVGALGVLPMAIMIALTPIGFFATFPVATSLAQRLQPGHTSLVSALMMGVGWAISSLAPIVAMAFFGGVTTKEAPLLSDARVNHGFLGFAALIVIAGALTVFISPRLVQRAADEH